MKEEAVLMIERDPILNDGYIKYDYSRPEARQRYAKDQLSNMLDALKSLFEVFTSKLHFIET